MDLMMSPGTSCLMAWTHNGGRNTSRLRQWVSNAAGACGLLTSQIGSKHTTLEHECGLQMVELASKKFVCIVDESKLVEGLGGSKGDQR